MDSSNIILFFILIVFNLFFYKYFILVLNKNYPKFLVDSQLGKPQAFHENPTSIAGGTCIFFSFLILFFYFLLFKNIIFLEYITFCTLLFLVGFMDDLKINFQPRIRLNVMIIFLIFLVIYNNFYLRNTGIEFLNGWIENSTIFSLIFICLCFLFIINGANLIDGFNGLLGIHSIIIFINLFFINFLNENYNLSNLFLFIILILIIFTIFNFPKAKIFLGDSGSYFLGTLLSVSVIQTSILNPNISPFYFCILLFYLFFEVFFSFFRKLIKEKSSPIYPDSKHLHMLLYKMLLKKNNDKLKSNYYVSVIINSIFFLLTLPAIFKMHDGLFCKYYSLLFFIIYIYFYKKLYAKIK